MITVKNKTSDNFIIQFNDQELFISDKETKTINKDLDEAKFSIIPNDNKLSFLGAVFIVLFSLIMLIFDEFLHIKIDDYIKLQVNVHLKNVGENCIVEITKPKQKFYCANVISNCDKEISLVYDKYLIKKQSGQFHKECALSLIIPALIFTIFAIFIIVSKSIVATIVLLALLIIAFFIWFYNHNNNQKIINELLKKSEEQNFTSNNRNFD